MASSEFGVSFSLAVGIFSLLQNPIITVKLKAYYIIKYYKINLILEKKPLYIYTS